MVWSVWEGGENPRTAAGPCRSAGEIRAVCWVAETFERALCTQRTSAQGPCQGHCRRVAEPPPLPPGVAPPRTRTRLCLASEGSSFDDMQETPLLRRLLDAVELAEIVRFQVEEIGKLSRPVAQILGVKVQNAGE